MKKELYEKPTFQIKDFMTENAITSSGVGENDMDVGTGDWVWGVE